jgi:predicted SAM-dependent methyltransferase
MTLNFFLKKIKSTISIPFRYVIFSISLLKWLKLRGNDLIFLELGSGPKRGENNWTTVDFFGVDIPWDLRFGIPLPDNSVSKIYTSHLLEHITFVQLIKFLKECRRCLNADGEFIVSVPNAELYLNAYHNKKYFRPHKECWPDAVSNTGSYIDQINYIAYMGNEHKYMFDEENLLNILLISGFNDAKIRRFDPVLDLLERDHESIYAIAYK